MSQVKPTPKTHPGWLEPETRPIADERTWLDWAGILLSERVQLHPLRTAMIFYPPVYPYLLAALLGRAYNRLKQTKKRDAHTADKDVLAYRWLPVDTDPVRPAGISASDEELKVALDRAMAINE